VLYCAKYTFLKLMFRKTKFLHNLSKFWAPPFETTLCKTMLSFFNSFPWLLSKSYSNNFVCIPFGVLQLRSWRRPTTNVWLLSLVLYIIESLFQSIQCLAFHKYILDLLLLSSMNRHTDIWINFYHFLFRIFWI